MKLSVSIQCQYVGFIVVKYTKLPFPMHTLHGVLVFMYEAKGRYSKVHNLILIPSLLDCMTLHFLGEMSHFKDCVHVDSCFKQ